MTPNRAGTRFTSRTTSLVMLLAVALALAAGGANAGDAGESVYAGMPEPDAFAAPVGVAAETGPTDANYQISAAKITLKAGKYALSRFDGANKLLKQRTVSFATAVRFRAANEPVLIDGQLFTLIDGGTWQGWHVATPDVVPTSPTAFAQPRNVLLAQTSHKGFRFHAAGRIQTHRVATLSTAAMSETTKEAFFGSKKHYLMSSGPLAGRWVAKSASASLQPATSSGVTVSAPLVTWKTLVLVYREIDVTYKRSDGTDYRLRARMSDYMYDLALSSVRRTVQTVHKWSGSMAALDMDVVDVPHPVTSLTPLGSGYWVGPAAVKPDLDEYAPAGRYDSIVVIFLPKDAAGVVIPVPGWGLTLKPGAWANGAGFSSVKTPLENWWWTDVTYPEEVFVHEWMHQVLGFHETTGHTDLGLHDDAIYGYAKVDGTYKAWLSDVMQGLVTAGTTRLGMDAAAWGAGKPTLP